MCQQVRQRNPYDLGISPDVYQPQGITALLAQLAALQQLTHLDISKSLEVHFHGLGGHASIDLAAYSALTASSQLQELYVWEPYLPQSSYKNVWHHVFKPARALPALRQLRLAEANYAWTHFNSNCSSPLDTLAVNMLVYRCPGLQRLSLAVQPDVLLHALLELTQLRCLHIFGVDEGGPVIEQLRQLPNLTELRTRQSHL